MLQRIGPSAQRSFESWIAECGRNLMCRSAGARSSGKKGRFPIIIPWVDVDKGFRVNRSRWLRRISRRERLVAGTPPLDLVKMLEDPEYMHQRGHVPRGLFVENGRSDIVGAV